MLKITKNQCRSLISAIYSGILNEESLIDAYSNVHNGDEVEPIKIAEKNLKEWNDILKILEEHVKKKV